MVAPNAITVILINVGRRIGIVNVSCKTRLARLAYPSLVPPL